MNCCRNCIYCRPLTRRGVVRGKKCDNNNSDNDGLEVSQWDTCDQFEEFRGWGPKEREV